MAVQGGGGEDVYATLLLTDTYLPGALVLAHSLRDAGTTKKLAVLVTLDSVSAEAISELQSVYNYVIPVPRIRNAQPANLYLMNRTDLHSAFTKINLWRQTQFRKIVYIDADVVAYRAPDELFNVTHSFSAAPDIGWPDLFNTGVMVLTPDKGEYYAMMAMAERGISFDGADQGLINMHFRNNYNRLSFTYNVTPSAHYQYIPAYRHFQSGINMVHFIGSDKPWFKGRHASMGSSPFDEMTGRWWAVYDRHYRAPSPRYVPKPPTQSSAIETAVKPVPHLVSGTPAQSYITMTAVKPVPQLVQYLTKGEYQPKSSYNETASKPYDEEHRGHEHHNDHVPSQYQELGHQQATHHQEHHKTVHHQGAPSFVTHSQHAHQQYDAHGHESPGPEADTHQPEPSSFVSSDVISSLSNNEDIQAEACEEQIHAHGVPAPPPDPEQKPAPFEPTMSSWDAQRHPPPTESKPEAMNFPATTYEMSKSFTPFVAPQRYPSPPKNMWYQVPKEAPAAPSEPPKPIFPWEAHRPKPSRVFPDEQPRVPQQPGTDSLDSPAGERQSSPQVQPFAESSVTGPDTGEQKSVPVTPITPTIQITPVDIWSSYTMTNAWDEIPEIVGYVDSMQKHRRSKSLKSPGVMRMPGPGEGADEVPWRRRGSKLTDFPSEVERPSLPVTPAPIRRPKFWGGGGPGIDDSSTNPLLPVAAGVPGQSDWDPVAQLQKLAKQHSEQLLEKLGGSGRDSSNLPPRPVPFGSEELVSPTYVAQSAQVLSPQPVKGSSIPSPVLNIVTDLEVTPRASPRPAKTSAPGAFVSSSP